jgi:hypothetical protein
LVIDASAMRRVPAGTAVEPAYLTFDVLRIVDYEVQVEHVNRPHCS